MSVCTDSQYSGIVFNLSTTKQLSVLCVSENMHNPGYLRFQLMVGWCCFLSIAIFIMAVVIATGTGSQNKVHVIASCTCNIIPHIRFQICIENCLLFSFLFSGDCGHGWFNRYAWLLSLCS